jgi:hypothetical protein
MRKVARQTLLSFVVVLFVLVSLAFVFLVQEVATGGGLETKEPTARHPLAKMTAAQYRGKTDEVFATLEAGVGLNDAVDLGLFEGFDSQMTLEAAKKDLGPPSGEWDDPLGLRGIEWVKSGA